MLQVTSIGALIAVYELSCRASIVTPLLFPPTSVIARRWAELLVSGDLSDDAITTVARALSGFSLALLSGIGVGLLASRVRAVAWFVGPVLAIGLPMPSVAFVPAFMLWFGIGHTSIILLVAFTCFFPIALSTQAGASQVSGLFVWWAQATGAKQGHVIARIILPATLPYIMNSIRVVLPLAFVITFVAEMVGGGGGLGYALVYAYRFLQTPTVFAVLLTVLMIGYLADRLVLWTRAWLIPWDSTN